MPKRRPHAVRNLETRTLADGQPAFYFIAPRAARKAGILKSVPLGRDVITAVEKAKRYNAVLDAWRHGEKSVAGTEPVHGSLDWGIRRFRQLRNRPTKKRKGPLSKKTQRDYDSYLDRVAEIRLTDGRRLGDVAMKEVKPRHARRIYEIFGKADKMGDITTHRAGLYAIQVCRRLWELVGRIELEIAINPFKQLDIGGVGAREVKWSYDDVMTFAETARKNNRLSLSVAALLCYDLVQRPCDMLRLTWGQLYAGTLVQSKGGQRAYFLLSPELDEALEALKRQNGVVLPRDNARPIVLSETSGRRYDERCFRKLAAKLRKKAKLRDELKIGDLRRSGATALTVAGATDSEARSVTGHATPAVFQKHYDVETAEKAEKAHIKRMAARERERAARAARHAARAIAPQDRETTAAPDDPEAALDLAG